MRASSAASLRGPGCPRRVETQVSEDSWLAAPAPQITWLLSVGPRHRQRQASCVALGAKTKGLGPGCPGFKF